MKIIYLYDDDDNNTYINHYIKHCLGDILKGAYEHIVEIVSASQRDIVCLSSSELSSVTFALHPSQPPID